MPAEESIAAEKTRESNGRQGSGGASRSKRRWTDMEAESRQSGDDNTNTPKRQRVSRACDQCRSKKDKCDGVQPVCSTCISLCRACTYKSNPKKRGLPTGYIRTLELLWGLVFCKVKGSEEVARALLKTANIPSHLATMGKEGEGADSILSAWKNSVVLKEIEKMLALLDHPEEESGRASTVSCETDASRQPERSNSLSSLSLEWRIPEDLVDMEGNIASHTVSSETARTPDPSGRSSSPRVFRDCGTQVDLPEQLPEEPRRDGIAEAGSRKPVHPEGFGHATPSSIQLPSNAWRLFDIYFSYTHCWFPIIEKHDVLRTAFCYNEGDVRVSCSTPGSGDHAAMWSILSLASIQDASLVSHRQVPENHDGCLEPDILYAVARSLIPPENGHYEIGHIQALLILSMVKFGRQDWFTAWFLIGYAIRIALHLGLDRPSTGESKEAADRKSNARRKHVFLGCFVLETLIASRTNRLPQLRKEDAARIGTVDEDGLEEWHPWEDLAGLRPQGTSRDSFRRGPLHALSTFNRLVSLLSILNDLCRCKHSQTATPSKLESIAQDLQRWVSELPKSCHVSLPPKLSTQSAPHLLGLHIAYESTVTALHLYAETLRNDQVFLERYLNGRVTCSNTLIQLLHAYVETYSLSATSPTFEIFLKLADGGLCDRPANSLASNAGLELKHKFQAMFSQLAVVWAPKDKAVGANSTAEITRAAVCLDRAAHDHPSRVPNRSQDHTAPQFPQGRINLDRIIDAVEDIPPRNTSRDSAVSPSWMRTNISASLPTPSPSLTTTCGASESSAQFSWRKDSMNNQFRQHDSTNALNPTIPMSSGFQHRQSHDSSSIDIGSLITVDRYGPPQQPRIPQDLDALFDELASLDGAEK